MVIDPNYKFENDDFNIYIIFELNKTISSAAFLIHNPPKGYSANAGLTVSINNIRLNVHITYSNPAYVFYKDFNILESNKKYFLEISLKNSNNSYYIKMNRQTLASGTITTALLGDLRFKQFKIGRNYNWNGATGAGTNTDSDFNLSEFIITNGSLTDSQKKEIENYLIKKYNVGI